MIGQIDIVLGGALGDEGKGLVTDWLARPDSLVVRFCGGAQAGHTVVEPNGRRHVFHQYGSGTFRGAATFLSEHVAFDPVALLNERRELLKLGVNPHISVDPNAPVCTPFDALLNQLTEMARGAGRHGSCGCGVGETFRRHEETPIRLYARDLNSPLLREKLVQIEMETRREIFRRGPNMNPGLLDRDMDECHKRFMDAVRDIPLVLDIEPFAFVAARHSHMVFEGAQGLLLDRDIGVFPFVTRAKTGLVNVEKMIGPKLREATVYFVSRCYMTRHGVGPLRGEVPMPFVDDTNVMNEWQGAMRYAPYDAELLEWARNVALHEVRGTTVGATRIITTHLDQIDETERARFEDASHFVSYGPTQDDVRVGDAGGRVK